MADGKLYLSATRDTARADVADWIDRIVGELGLPEAWEDRIYVGIFAGKLILLAKEAVSEGFGFRLPEDALVLPIEGVKLRFIIDRWLAAGGQIGPNGEFLLWSPRMGVDP